MSAVRVRFASAVEVRRVLEPVAAIVAEASWDISQSEIRFTAMDSSHTTLLNVSLDNAKEIVCPRPACIGVSMVALSKILKTASKDDDLEFALARHDADKLSIAMRGPERSAEYELRLMVISAEDLSAPADEDLEAPMAKLRIPARRATQCISAVSNSDGDAVDLELSNDGSVTCTVHGTQFRARETLRPACDGAHERVKARLRLSLVQAMLKCAAPDIDIEIWFGPNMPAVFRMGATKGYVAPVIVDERENMEES